MHGGGLLLCWSAVESNCQLGTTMPIYRQEESISSSCRSAAAVRGRARSRDRAYERAPPGRQPWRDRRSRRARRPWDAARRRARYIWGHPGGRVNSMSRKPSRGQQELLMVRSRERRLFLGGLCGAGLAAAFGLGGAVPRPLHAQAAPRGLSALPLRGGLALVEGAGGNVVVLETEEGLALVDSGAPASAAELTRFLAERYPRKSVEVLFNTHWHLEHTGGNDALGAAGATIVAHENTRLWMSTEFYVDWQDR